MPQFIETIAFEKGNYPLLSYHQERVNRAFAGYFPGQTPHDLSQVLPELNFDEKHKVRMVYGQDTIDIEYSLHQKRDIRRLTLAYDDEISYDHKFVDRANLKQHYDNRGEADEVIIIKNGLVTDSFWANLVFFDSRKWVTPDSNLLPGVMRAYLLDRGEIESATIYDYEIAWFEKIGLINALNPLGEIVIDAEDLVL